MTKTRIALVALTALLALPSASLAHRPKAETVDVAGLERKATVLRDTFGVPHVFAKSEHDAYFMVGYLHAQDRLFQMDSSRRQASGTLAELLGSSALASDVQLRTLGVRRAAVRSMAAISPESRATLEAYADGVNAWLAANPLPSEYAALELTKANVPSWTALDSLAVSKLISLGLSFETNDITNTQRLIAYQTAGAAAGFDGRKLFFEDVMRSEPFAHAPSILPGETSGSVKKHGKSAWSSSSLAPDVGKAAREALENVDAANLPTAPADQGSNIWVVSGKKSASGRPMVASDPHLALPSPATFYEVGVDVNGRRSERLTLYGVTFPGTPAVVHGTNGHVSWGSTVNPTDVTDIYQEQLTLAGGVPVATTYQGNLEPTQIIPETFRANQPGNGTADDVVVVPPAAGVPPATIVVPRRNNGPLLSVTGTTGLSVQFTGFSPTREVDFFRLLSRADTVAEAIDAQRYFDFGAQNWMYVDDRGIIGYKTSAEIPLREDLQAGTVTGLPPYFIRNGTGGNEWIADPSPAEDQASAYEILPVAEMDGLVNPKRGWISNANQDPNGQTFDNDPLNELRPGGGIRYITPGHSDGNRNARVTRRLAGGARRRRLVLGDAVDPGRSAAPRRRGAHALHHGRAAGGPDSGRTAGPRRARGRPEGAGSGRPPRGLAVLDADRHRGGLRRDRSVRVPAPADPGGDRRQRRHDDLQPLARPCAGGDRGRPAHRPWSRQLPAGRRSGDDRAPAPARDGRHRGLGDRLLRRARRS